MENFFSETCPKGIMVLLFGCEIYFSSFQNLVIWVKIILEVVSTLWYWEDSPKKVTFVSFFICHLWGRVNNNQPVIINRFLWKLNNIFLPLYIEGVERWNNIKNVFFLMHLLLLLSFMVGKDTFLVIVFSEMPTLWCLAKIISKKVF